MTLYQLRTNLQSSKVQFALVPEQEGAFFDLPISAYEAKAQPVPGLSGGAVQVSLLPPDYTMPEVLTAWVTKPHNNRSKIDANRIPDVWSTHRLPTVSGRFKALIEEIDPGVHRFFPITIKDYKSGDLLSDKNHFRFMCGRLVRIEPADTIVAQDKCDVFWLAYPPGYDFEKLEARIYQRLVADPAVQSVISGLPLWRFDLQSFDGLAFGPRNILYANGTLVTAAQKAKFRGFAETEGFTKRDVNHVWY